MHKYVLVRTHEYIVHCATEGWQPHTQRKHGGTYGLSDWLKIGQNLLKARQSRQTKSNQEQLRDLSGQEQSSRCAICTCF